ncbi:hypothetical protein [Acidovorax sp. SRB_24]|uniref:hypothetical protein n=1 Tax=Acidovorax sp. SRB_24 TaxID=1962700 RepID=UPI001F0D1271|nr:hypothetical protein [Acidovorax sp. SRB_24]
MKRFPSVPDISQRPVRAQRRPRLGAAAAVLLCAALAGCASRPPVPDWQLNAHGAAEKAVQAYLSGDARAAQRAFDNARAETARTGQPALLARVELLRCAAQVASLVSEPCSAFEALREDAADPETAYAHYLAGQAQPADVALLPAAQQGVAAAAAAGDADHAAAALARIPDPLSRLVAAGVLLRSGQASPPVVAAALDAASRQGWRRPLLAWLALQAARAEAAADAEEAARLRRRMAVVERSGAAQ